MLCRRAYSRSEARAAEGRYRNHVQHGPLPPGLFREDGTACFPDPRVNLGALWRRVSRRASPVPRAPVLDAGLRARIRQSFDAASRDDENFPSTIDPRIEHVRVILNFFGDLADKRVLDA